MHQNKLSIVRNTAFIAAIIIVGLIPTYIWFIPPFMVLWGISWVFDLEETKKMASWEKYKYSILLCTLFLGYYLWQLIGISYSTEKSTGWRFFLSRLSLFLFPLVLVIPGEKIKTNCLTIVRIFALASLLYILLCFGYAFFLSVSLNNGHLNFNPHPPEAYWTSYFYGFYFSFNQHTSYISVYVILSVFIAFESWFDKNLSIVWRKLWLLAALILMASVYFLSSRTGILVMIILAPLYLLIKFRKKLKLLVAIVILAAAIILAFIVVRTNVRTSVFINGALSGTFKEAAVKDGRLVIWEAAMNPIKKNLIFGVGTGGVDAVMGNEYLRIGNQELLKGRYNLHCQYLEILLENGLIGLLLFAAMIGIMIYTAILQRNLLYGFFLITMIVFFLFETVLNRLSGVSFFSLFSFLLIYLPKTSETKDIYSD
jgi:O-antigen ligase